jgi:hypothetical protein
MVIPVCIRPPHKRGNAAEETLFSGDTIRCALTLRDDPARGLAAGFQYALFRKYTADTGCEALIRLGDPEADWGDSLRAGTVDVVIATLPPPSGDGLMATRTFGDSTVWILRDEGVRRVRHINGWIADLVSTPQYQRERKAFFRQRGDLSSISPYDRIVKRCAAAIGWDWRLVSSVIYHESRFTIDAASPKGAVGLMQIVPRRHSADTLLDPETNIRVGTAYLAKLERMFGPGSANRTESIKFALAAFNAGEGTIQRYIGYAASQAADSTRWNSVAAAARGMEGFKGGRTIAYVDSVLTTYYGYTRFYGE